MATASGVPAMFGGQTPQPTEARGDVAESYIYVNRIEGTSREVPTPARDYVSNVAPISEQGNVVTLHISDRLYKYRVFLRNGYCTTIEASDIMTNTDSNNDVVYWFRAIDHLSAIIPRAELMMILPFESELIPPVEIVRKIKS